MIVEWMSIVMKYKKDFDKNFKELAKETLKLLNELKEK